jgi:hypothetical protein
LQAINMVYLYPAPTPSIPTLTLLLPPPAHIDAVSGQWNPEDFPSPIQANVSLFPYDEDLVTDFLKQYRQENAADELNKGNDKKGKGKAIFDDDMKEQDLESARSDPTLQAGQAQSTSITAEIQGLDTNKDSYAKLEPRILEEGEIREETTLPPETGIGMEVENGLDSPKIDSFPNSPAVVSFGAKSEQPPQTHLLQPQPPHGYLLLSPSTHQPGTSSQRHSTHPPNSAKKEPSMKARSSKTHPHPKVLALAKKLAEQRGMKLLIDEGKEGAQRAVLIKFLDGHVSQRKDDAAAPGTGEAEGTEVMDVSPVQAPTPPPPPTPSSSTGTGRSWNNRKRGKGRLNQIRSLARSSSSNESPTKSSPASKEPTSQSGELDGLIPPGTKVMDQQAKEEWAEGVREKKEKEVWAGVGRCGWW